MRVLILGGSGMLGTDLRATVPAGWEVAAPASAALDVTDAGAVGYSLDSQRPDIVVNAAAYTRVDDAEADEEAARRVNTDAPRLIGEACAALGIRVVHYSTDYVFDGTSSVPYREESPAGPLNAYGRSKLDGERALLATGADALVIRTSWLFGANGPSFPRTMLQRARQGLATRVVDDQHGRPTSTHDLAIATWRLVERRASGVLHLTNGGPVTTWFGIAQRVFDYAGRADLLKACSGAEFPTAAARPAHSALDTTRAEGIIGSTAGWEPSLDRFLAEIGAS